MSRTRGPKTKRDFETSLLRERQARFGASSLASVRTHELYEALRRLRESESRYRLLAENATDYIALYDQYGRSIYRSPSMARLFGPAMSQTGHFLDAVHPDDRGELESLVAGVRQSGTAASMQFRFIAHDGREIWADASCKAVTDQPGQTQSVLIAARDITERKRVEAAFHETEAFELFLRHAPAAIAVLDKEMRYVAVSDRWLSDYAVTSRGIAGKTHYEVFPNIPEHWKEAHRRALAGEVLSGDDEPFIGTGGKTEWVRWEVRPWRDSEGEIAGIIIFSEVVTERKLAEERLLQTQKMDAIGELTGGLAHDFNNLLGIVIGNLDWLGEHLPDDDKVRRRFRSALEAAERGADITHSLLAIARRRPLEMEVVDVNALVVGMLPLIRTSVGAEITVRSRLEEGSLPVRLDASGLNNALLNLAINARDALRSAQSARELLIQTRLRTYGEDNPEGLAPGAYAVVSVRDNGGGMSEAVRTQAFEPFFTTKERGRGTGLGLAVVYGYAEQLGGTASIESEPGKGTTVEILLPLDEQAREQREKIEAERLEALGRTGLLDSEPESEYDEIVREIAGICGVPIGLVTLVDQDRQWFKAKFGLELAETPRDVAFCAHAIHRPDEPLIINDASRDDRFSGNPLVTGDAHIRFYAGMPLVDAGGHALGTLCVVDVQPHELSARQLSELRRLARKVSELIVGRDKKAHEVQAVQPIADSHQLSVLVVDDEEALCDLAANWFTSMGFDVSVAHDPAEASRALQSRKFDLLFTDVVMPGDIDGIELARQARQRDPELKILITSGYADSLIGDIADLPGPLLGKPYRKPQLLKAVQQLGIAV